MKINDSNIKITKDEYNSIYIDIYGLYDSYGKEKIAFYSFDDFLCDCCYTNVLINGYNFSSRNITPLELVVYNNYILELKKYIEENI